jgi:hypothetical protein
MHPSSLPAARRHAFRGRLRCVFGALLVPALLRAGIDASPSAFAATGSPTVSPSASSSGAGSAAPTPAAGKAATPEITWGIGPTAPVGTSQRPYFSFGVTPGAQANDHVTVSNFSTTPLMLSVYAVLADNNADTGAIGFVSRTDTPVDASSWLTVGSARPDTVTVPGRANGSAPPGVVTLPVKLIVPLNAQPGDHVAGIVAALTVASNNAQGEHVNLEQRVVTRVYVRVSGPLHPKLEIANLHASYHEKGFTLAAGSVLVSYTVRNVGNVRVAATQSVGVSGLLGSAKKVTPANIVQLLPGGEEKVAVVVRGVLPTVLVKPHVTVTPTAFPGDVDPPLTKLSSSTWTWAVPWALLLVIVLVLAALWWRRRRQRARRAPVTQTVVLPGSSGRHRVDAAQPTTRSRHAR